MNIKKVSSSITFKVNIKANLYHKIMFISSVTETLSNLMYLMAQWIKVLNLTHLQSSYRTSYIRENKVLQKFNFDIVSSGNANMESTLLVAS